MIHNLKNLDYINNISDKEIQKITTYPVLHNKRIFINAIITITWYEMRRPQLTKISIFTIYQKNF